MGRGNRFFVGTGTFVGPAVADGAILPTFSTLQCEVDVRVALESRINWLASPARIVAERVKGCVYRKLKHGRSGDEVRPGWRVN